jgi:NAD(P)H-hydrate epimerase
MELPQLPPREAASHKGHYGRALLIGGSAGMTGAIGLAGMGALRGGAGLVTLGVPATCQPVVAAYEPSYMTWALTADSEGRLDLPALDLIKQRQADFNCWACGPGLGRSAALVQLVAWLYENIEQPLILDADAIHALGEREEGLAAPAGPRILTPHPGEFQFLNPPRGPTTSATEQLRERDEARATELAQMHQLVIVLKGHRTLVTDGQQSFRNDTGNPGMATGGSGDVLTGLITALVCQGLDVLSAACLGVHVHGRAGDLAALQLGQAGLIASDLVQFLPVAMDEQTRQT